MRRKYVGTKIPDVYKIQFKRVHRRCDADLILRRSRRNDWACVVERAKGSPPPKANYAGCWTRRCWEHNTGLEIPEDRPLYVQLWRVD